jgi:hypothetical protein
MANWKDEITLIAATTQEDNENGFALPPAEQSRVIDCNVNSAGQNEFYKAAQIGKTAKKQIEVHTADYEGEVLAELDGERYEITRTFSPGNGEFTELYLSDLRQGGGDG